MSIEERSPFKKPRPGSHSNFMPRKRLSAPNLPPTPYMRFCRSNWEKLKLCYSENKKWNLGRVMGQLWRDLPEKEKEPYFESYNADKAEFDKKLKAYYCNSNGKNRTSDCFHNENEMSLSEYKLLLEAQETCIEPAEDEEDFSVDWLEEKHIAYARYKRNDFLMKNILSETKLNISCAENNLNLNEKIGNFKRSASTLEAYLKRSTFEIQSIEQKHKELLAKIHNSSATFQNKLKEMKAFLPQRALNI